MNEIVAFDRNTVAPVAASAAAKMRERRKARSSRPKDSVDYMKFKQGVYTYGKDYTQPSPDSLWAVQLTKLGMSWVEWVDEQKRPNELTWFEFVLTDGENPQVEANPDDFPEVPEAFDPEKAEVNYNITMGAISGPDKGVLAKFTSNSKGGEMAYGHLGGEIEKQIEANPDYPNPVVKIVAGYTFKGNLKIPNTDKWTKGDVKAPRFEVVDWADNKGNLLFGEVASDADGSAPEASQGRRRRNS